MIGRIMVATDGSAHAQKAVEFASDMAVQYGAKLFVLHVVSSSRIPEEVRQYIENERFETPPGNAFLLLAGEGIIKAAEGIAYEKGVKEIHSSVAHGDPAEEILRFSREHSIEAIVIGCRGLSRLAGLLMGSVSSKVCHLADCTCIMIK